MAVTHITLLRKGSKGIEGTIANAEHHAERILPFIDAMKDEVAKLGFKTWAQGHNIHQFEAQDGTCFTLRPIGDNSIRGFYTGVRLSLRLSRSQECRIIDVDSVDEVPQLLGAMRLMSKGSKGHCRNGLAARD